MAWMGSRKVARPNGTVSGVGRHGGRADRCAWAPMQRRGDDLGHHLARSDWATRNLRREQLVWTRAAELVEAAVEETLAYYAFPEEHWRRIRTNNPLERILREIRRRTRVVGAFPDGQSALNLAAARLRHIAGTA
jgi:transposase-like protein